MEKLYCYVDETGQDTYGKLFIVVAIVTSKERDDLVTHLENAEHLSGKGRLKWVKTKKNFEFVRLALTEKWLKYKIFYSIYYNTKDYDHLTIQTITHAIKRYLAIHQIDEYSVTIIIDGLKPKQELEYGVTIRHLGIITEKVKGLKDQGDALIRLSDTSAGVIRESEEGRETYQVIRSKLERLKIFNEIS